MDFAASELVEIFFKEQFRGLEDNAHQVMQSGAHAELSVHAMLLSSSRQEVRDEGLLNLVLMPAELHKTKEQKIERIASWEARNDGPSLLMAAGLAQDLQDSSNELRLLIAAKEKKSCMAGMQLGAKSLEAGDLRTALKHYRHSALLSNPIAQHKLGYLLEQPGEFQNLTEASKFYLKGGDNGHPDSYYNLSLMVDGGLVPCPDHWSVQKLMDASKSMGCPSAKSSWVQASIDSIDTLSAAELKVLWDVAWDSYVEEPEVANHSFFLGCLYVPTAVKGNIPRSFDIAKAIHFLKLSKRLHPDVGRDSLLQNILTACPVIPPETSPTIATLTSLAEKRVLDFKINRLKAKVTEWTKMPASPQLMVYCSANMMDGRSSSSPPTNAVVFASLLSKSLDTESAPENNQNHTPFADVSSPMCSTEDNEPIKEKGAPHLFDMTPQETIQLITSFHSKRMEWGFATDPTDFPFRLPDINGPFSRESFMLLAPVLSGLFASEELKSLADIITTMQPHGALIALYLLEIPFFAREMNEWKKFPLEDIILKVASNCVLAEACMEVLCSSHVEVDVANACLHLLTSFKELCDEYDCKFLVKDFEVRVLKAVLSFLRRGTTSIVSVEFLVSCVKLFGSFYYTKSLLHACGQDISEIKILLAEAMDPSSNQYHPEFNSTCLSPQVMSVSNFVVREVIGIESSAETFSSAKSRINSAFRKEKSSKLCALPGCVVSTELKLCSRCGVVNYCSAEHQKADWKKHKVYCKKK